MSKKFLFGLAALLSVSLFMLGCPQEADDDPEPTAAEKAAAELGEALGSDKATVSGTTVTLTADYTVADAATLAVPAGVKLVVPNDKTFTVAGTLNNSGEIEVASGGEYVVEAGASDTISGALTIKSGGEVWGKGGSLAGAGFTVVETGGKAYLGDAEEAKIEVIGPTPAGEGVAPVVALTSGSISYNSTNYELDGAATVNGLPSQNTYMVGGSDRKLKVKAGGVLTVPGTNNDSDKHILVVIVGDDGPGIVGEPAAGGKAAARIVLAEYGCIDIYASTGGGEHSVDISQIGHNFYNSEGAKQTSNTSGFRGTTYNWDGTLNTNAGGWKAEAAE